ncbi:MAG: hypothetical protein HWD61_08975 [Parachlamydiaceae bacterium]|nr:MAG: hypothetical protein HWD61_08975 [Parachlamydiaceae bacterium]
MRFSFHFNLAILVVYCSTGYADSIEELKPSYLQVTEPVLTSLKERQPNWRMETLESYPNGIPKNYFYAPLGKKKHL